MRYLQFIHILLLQICDYYIIMWGKEGDVVIVGKRIKQRRKELKMSADKLASMLGKDRSTIYRYEKGDIENLPLDILEPVAKALQTTPQFLMGWEEDQYDKKRTATDNGSGISEAKQKLFDLADSCSEEEALRLLQMMELFLGRK